MAVVQKPVPGDVSLHPADDRTWVFPQGEWRSGTTSHDPRARQLTDEVFDEFAAFEVSGRDRVARETRRWF